jgi:hypothetical protein
MVTYHVILHDHACRAMNQWCITYYDVLYLTHLALSYHWLLIGLTPFILPARDIHSVVSTCHYRVELLH